MRSKLKLALIANKSTRRATFKKRKSGIMKKLYELTTLCDVKACAVISSPFEVPQVWPSKEGVEEAVSKVMEMSETERFKKTMNHETYLHDRIAKAQGQLNTLCTKNRESQLRHFMFDCLQGKSSSEYHPCDARNLQDLSIHIDDYIKQLHNRLRILTENGESSSSLPPLPDVLVGPNLPLVADSDLPFVAAAAPIGNFDFFQYHNMNMNQNQHELVEHHVPAGFNDYQIMNMNQNQQEPVQYQAPIDFNDQFQQTSLDANQYLFQPQEMGHVGEHAQIPFIDGSHYNYHQLPATDLATGGHMPSINTTEVHAPCIYNNL